MLTQYVKDWKVFFASVKEKALSIDGLTKKSFKKNIDEAASKDVSENIHLGCQFLLGKMLDILSTKEHSLPEQFQQYPDIQTTIT